MVTKSRVTIDLHTCEGCGAGYPSEASANSCEETCLCKHEKLYYRHIQGAIIKKCTLCGKYLKAVDTSKDYQEFLKEEFEKQEAKEEL